MTDISSALQGKTAFAAYVNMITNELERSGHSKDEAHESLKIINSSKSFSKRIPFYEAVEYWHAASDIVGKPLFALSAGANVHPGDFGPLGLLTTHCKTVGESWQLAYKYQHIIADGLCSQLIIDGDTVSNRVDCLDLDPEWSRPYVEHDFVALLMIARYATANLLSNTRFTIHFRHQPAAELTEYQAIFDADYRFGMPYDQIIFPRAVLSVAVYSPNEDVFELLSNKVANLFKNTKHNFPLQVESFIEDQLLMGKHNTLESCSQNFHVSASTFKRRLATTNSSYQELCDKVKLRVAKKMLSNKDIKISHIAHALGYSGSAQFTRFLKNMTGLSPTEYRKT